MKVYLRQFVAKCVQNYTAFISVTIISLWAWGGKLSLHDATFMQHSLNKRASVMAYICPCFPACRLRVFFQAYTDSRDMQPGTAGIPLSFKGIFTFKSFHLLFFFKKKIKFSLCRKTKTFCWPTYFLLRRKIIKIPCTGLDYVNSDGGIRYASVKKDQWISSSIPFEENRNLVAPLTLSSHYSPPPKHLFKNFFRRYLHLSCREW